MTQRLDFSRGLGFTSLSYMGIKLWGFITFTCVDYPLKPQSLVQSLVMVGLHHGMVGFESHF